MAKQLGSLVWRVQARVMDVVWDCVIIGGGAAGLSAALVLGRARRRTLLVDAGHQSNLAAHGIGGLLGHDGRSPAELYAMGRREVAAYPSVEVRTGDVVSWERTDGGFILELADGRRESARRVVLATGMDYRRPELPGLTELWGRSVFHCPFCHGWEVRDEPLAVLASGDLAVQKALLLRGWSDDVVLLTDGPSDLAADDRARLAAAGIAIDERRVAELIASNGELAEVAFADGGRVARRGLLVVAPLHHRSALAEQLGAETGVFAAGDVSAEMPSVAGAIAAGSQAAAAVVHSLVADDYGLPSQPWRKHVTV
jgi:thioredoxin reductase